jgi:hypothetical protein
MVAALGVTLPSPARYGQWFDAAQDWASGVLADWDTCKNADLLDDRASDAVGELDCPRCQLARARFRADQPGPAGVAELSDSMSVMSVAYSVLPAPLPPILVPMEPLRPDRISDSAAAGPAVRERGLFSAIAAPRNGGKPNIANPPQLPTNPDPAAVASAPAIPTPRQATPEPFEPIAPSNDIELSVLAELCRMTTEAAPAERPTARAPGALGGTDRQTSVCGRGEIGESQASEPGRSMPQPQAPSAESSPIALTEMDLDFRSPTPWMVAGSLEFGSTQPQVSSSADHDPPGSQTLFTEASPPADLPGDVFGPSPETTLADLPQAVFGPPRVASPPQHVQPKIAVTLADLPHNVFAAPAPNANASAEIARSGSGSSGGSRLGGPRLGHAFELTRDALYAWMNVLTGPALVEMTSR